MGTGTKPRSRSSSASKTSLASYPALDVRFDSAPDVERLQELLHAELDTFQPLAIHEDETSDGWRVFFPTLRQRDDARTALATALGDRLSLSPIDVEDEGWARRSQASLGAVHVRRITVAPPWDVPTDRDSGIGIREPENYRDAGSGIRDPEKTRDSGIGIGDSKDTEVRLAGSASPESQVPDSDRILIIIEPSMGFGTGHHETTRLCLELMQQLDFGGTRVIDVGTGSGILALAAWKLGAARVTAVDCDPDALQNARDNIARNRGSGIIQVLEADLSALTADPVDIVLANLTAAVLQRHAAALRGLVAREGTLVVSGFSPGEIDGVASAFGLVPRRVEREGEWAAAMFGRR
jgi:ribosomal protein L11 methylase PrmA